MDDGHHPSELTSGDANYLATVAFPKIVQGRWQRPRLMRVVRNGAFSHRVGTLRISIDADH